MKKRLLVLLVFGVTFSPAVFAEGSVPSGQKNFLNDYAPGSFQCAENREGKKGDSKLGRAGGEQAGDTIQGASKGS